MSRKFIIFTIIIISLLSLSSCAKNKEDIKNVKSIDFRNEVYSEPINKIKVDLIKEQIKNMTLDEKIGQLFILGLDGYEINDNTIDLIKNKYIGGVIIYSKNVKNTNQLLDLVNSLKSVNSVNKIPLLLSIDEEGGRVSRMPDIFEDFPTNKEIGKINNKSFSYNIGSAIAKEIKSFGFNMNFSPVLDINSNIKNPVIGDRSFGSNEIKVSELGIQTMKGIKSQNVIPVIKHFPGHGDTSVDSHIGLPKVNKNLNELKSFELIPFNEAIKNGADVVMIAHILLPNIDDKNPSSLSKDIVTNLLRNELNFKGVVITDDLTMGAIINNYTLEEASIKSLNAGTDILLVAHGYDNAINTIECIKKEVEAGRISEKRIDESVCRILSLKKKYNLNDNIIDSIDVKSINNEINIILSEYIK